MKRSITLAFCILVVCGGCAKEQERAGSTRTYPGMVVAGETAMLAFQAAGKVIEMPVVPGQHVKKGDVLARIDPRDFEQAVAAAKAPYIETERNVERYRSLHEKDLVATAEVQAKERDAEILKAHLEKAEKALKDTTLVAPFDGVISQKLVENYQTVRPGEAVIRIQNTDQLKIVIHMPEKDAIHTDPGTIPAIKATASFTAVPGREFTLRTTEWETEADPRTQTFRVTFLMDKQTGINILPGMTAQVRLAMPTQISADADDT